MSEQALGSKSPRCVFVVHGRTPLRDQLFAFLRSLSLAPLEWNHLVRLTGEPNPYVGRVLRAGFEHAQAAVVLLTGDDEARLRADLLLPTDPAEERQLTPQPRQNVLLEAGMALGMFEQRTVLIQFGPQRVISDLLGRHIVRLNNSAKSRKELVERLKLAGCEVDDSGGDWLTHGTFSEEFVANGNPIESAGGPTPSQASNGTDKMLSQEELEILLLMLDSGTCTLWKTPTSQYVRIVNKGMGAGAPIAQASYVAALHELEQRNFVRSGGGAGYNAWKYDRYELTHAGRVLALARARAGDTVRQGAYGMWSEPEEFDLKKLSHS